MRSGRLPEVNQEQHALARRPYRSAFGERDTATVARFLESILDRF
jgi:hypothetical protein